MTLTHPPLPRRVAMTLEPAEAAMLERAARAEFIPPATYARQVLLRLLTEEDRRKQAPTSVEAA